MPTVPVWETLKNHQIWQTMKTSCPTCLHSFIYQLPPPCKEYFSLSWGKCHYDFGHDLLILDNLIFIDANVYQADQFSSVSLTALLSNLKIHQITYLWWKNWNYHSYQKRDKNEGKTHSSSYSCSCIITASDDNTEGVKKSNCKALI